MLRETLPACGSTSAIRAHCLFPTRCKLALRTRTFSSAARSNSPSWTELGHPRTDATWTVDNSSIATISTDASPTLTGVAAGIVNLTASIGSVTSQIQVNILAGTSLPVGTVLWTAPTTPGNTVQQIAQAMPSLNGPDLFSIESGSSILIKALTSDGRILWQTQLAAGLGPKALPDGSGGLLLNVSFPTSNGSGTQSVVDLDGQTGSQVWRF